MKRKKGGIEIVFLLIIFLSLLAIATYVFSIKFSDLFSEPITLTINKTALKQKPSFPSGNSQFYPNMRFSKNNLRYNIEDSCSEIKKTRMKQAFDRIESETNLIKFIPVQDNKFADILVACEESNHNDLSGEYFIAGEGGPTSVINASLFYIIESGKILLFYKKSKCDNYNIELHELLHVFGFKHSDNPNSIMYNTSSCSQVLTNDIVEELKRLYSIKPLPDLYFEDASATQHGSYLDFKTTIRNQGISIARDIKLEIYDNNENKIDEFELENINYGEGKNLEVENAKLPSRSIKKIKFIIIAGEELDKKNNIIELVP